MVVAIGLNLSETRAGVGHGHEALGLGNAVGGGVDFGIGLGVVDGVGEGQVGAGEEGKEERGDGGELHFGGWVGCEVV